MTYDKSRSSVQVGWALSLVKNYIEIGLLIQSRGTYKNIIKQLHLNHKQNGLEMRVTFGYIQ
jgi:hypothetical protein